MRFPVTPALLAVTALFLGGCEWRWPSTAAEGSDSAGMTASLVDAPGSGVGPPLGGVPGGMHIGGEPNMANPASGTPDAVNEGHRLFLAMNCASCHGYKAKGAMGPDLTDKEWRYAGTPAAIFNSIAQGRPQGMPSWGRTLPEQQIWEIVAYIQSLGGAYRAGEYNASLEGDTDKTLVAPGYATVEKVTASLTPPDAAPAPAADAPPPTPPGLKQ